MARVRLEIPASLQFRVELDVRITDINYGGHLGNDALLSLLHEARIRFFGSLGYSEKDVEGAAIIMTDAVLLYRSEAFHGDRLRIGVGVTDHGTSTCDIVYMVENVATGVEVARAKTGIAFFDYTTRRVVSMPVPFRMKTGGDTE